MLGLPDLGDDREAEQQGSTAARAWARVARGPAGRHSRAHAERAGRRPPVGLVAPGWLAGGRLSAQAWKRCRRIAATLEKIRIAEHDDHAGRQLRADAELVAEVDDQRGHDDVGQNETTKTLSSKIPSRMARTPPNTASSAATTAIGR